MYVNLVSPAFRRLISIVKKGSIGLNIAVVTVLLCFSLCGVFDNTQTAILCAVITLILFGPMMFPGLYYEKVCRSYAQVSNGELQVLDKKGRCWRSFPLSSITDLQVKEIAGFFYGKYRMNAKDTYLCIFMNGATEIPETSYHKLFFQDNFFMVSYDKAFTDYLVKKTGDG